MSESAHTISACRVLALCGGVGGAKLAFGLQSALGEDLLVAVNTGDDFEYLGLSICPDLDTVMYTLSGLSDRQRGWGRADESWHCMQTLAALDSSQWFQLGDKDLAVHIYRTWAMREGRSLSDVTWELNHKNGVRAQIVPMSDGAVRTVVDTDIGPLPFQDYFVKHRCVPVVKEIHYTGAHKAVVHPEILAALSAGSLEAVVVCPSNPYLSIAPILALPGLREALRKSGVPVLVVSPIVAGEAVKGPTTKLMRELGSPVSNATIANFYKDIANALVTDEPGFKDVPGGLETFCTDTLMRDDDDRNRLAHKCLKLVGCI